MEKTESHSQLAESGMLPLRRGLLLFAPLLVAASIAGVMLRYPQHGAAILFPPYAALTAVLLATRRRDWIVYVAITVLGHFAASLGPWSFSWVALTGLGIMARSCIAALLLQRLLGPHPRLDGVASLVRFVLAAAIVAPAVGATIASTNVLLHDSPETYTATWSARFTSNALTALVMLPVLLEVTRWLSTWRLPRLGRRRLIEITLFGASLAMSSALASGSSPSAS